MSCDSFQSVTSSNGYGVGQLNGWHTQPFGWNDIDATVVSFASSCNVLGATELLCVEGTQLALQFLRVCKACTLPEARENSLTVLQSEPMRHSLDCIKR